MNLDIYPVNGTNKDKCTHQLLWIQEYCIGRYMDYSIASYNLSFPENNGVSCWACEEARARDFHKECIASKCESCPVTWFEGTSHIIGAYCIDINSPYCCLYRLEDTITTRNTQRVIDLIQKTWEE